MGQQLLLKSGDAARGAVFDNTVPLGESEDATKIIGSNISAVDCVTTDTRCRTSAHCDDFQLIPTKSHMRFFGAIAENVEIVGGELDSNGSMQGVFSSDGGYRDLVIRDRVITTESEHKVSLCGVLDNCVIGNLKDKHGDPVRILLDNMRFGGGVEGNFYALSFKDHHYGDVVTDQALDDRRGNAWRKNAEYVEDFDLNLFYEIAESMKYVSVEDHLAKCKAEYKIATSMSDERIEFNNYLEMTDNELMKWAERWPNFKPYEMASRDFSIKMDVKSLDRLQALRNEWGKPLHINSAYRTKLHNDAVGGKRNSDHLKGTAFDIHVNSMKMGRVLEKLAIKHGFNAIGRYRKSMFIHVSSRKPKKNGNIYQWGVWQ